MTTTRKKWFDYNTVDDSTSSVSWIYPMGGSDRSDTLSWGDWQNPSTPPNEHTVITVDGKDITLGEIVRILRILEELFKHDINVFKVAEAIEKSRGDKPNEKDIA